MSHQHMTVADLIEALEDFDPNAVVLVHDGFSNEDRPLESVMRKGKSPRDRANHRPLLCASEDDEPTEKG